MINNNYQTIYDYVSIGNRTSNIIKTITNSNNEYLYKYDKTYNVTDIYLNNNLINKYEYNSNDELISDYDYINDIKNEYLYDDNGNILSRVKKIISTNENVDINFYEYGYSLWEDLLTKYNDETISYDEIGNPVVIGNKSLTWVNGRQLNSYTDGNLSISYKYNMNGIRSEKTINGVKTEYYLDDNNIIYEKTENNVIYYMYDNSGVAGLKHNNMVYYFVKNLQGDIIGILNSNLELIVKYEYDSFGNILSIKDLNDNIILDEENIGIINPFRYRGYYYDKEIELYYLNARYYNPKWGRFLNADELIELSDNYLSKNLFLYTNNNYINLKDKNGTYPIAANPDWKTLKDIADAIGAIGAAGAAIGSSVAAAAPYLVLTFGAVWAISTIADAISSAKSETLSCKKPKTVYNRAYVSKETNRLVVCKEELTYGGVLAEYVIDDKSNGKNKNILRKKIEDDCQAKQADFKAIGYYTSKQYAAAALAKGLSPVSHSRFDSSSKMELIFVRHYHPAKQKDYDGIHVWFGDYVVTRR